MKTKSRKVVSIILAILLIVGCMSQELTVFASTELPEGLLLDGEISVDETVTVEVTKGCVSLLKFTPDVSGVYQFESYSDMDLDIDTYGYLYDAKFNELTSDDDSSDNGYNFLFTYRLIAGKTYYLGAKFADSNKNGAFNVTLTYLFECDHIDINSDETCDHCGAIFNFTYEVLEDGTA
ncbi:MAG: hypothetical protein IKW45_07500, partial [Clostridia bacterium]|nr:hypothetical protein [Clostridia bacterium]